MTDFIQSNVTVDTPSQFKANIDQGFAALSQSLPRNRILNSDWLIDQTNEGALYTCNSSAGVQTVDGWTGRAENSSGVFKVRRITDPDFANQSCLEITCTTADGTIGTNDRYFIQQNIEGYDVADLRSGLASAAKITIAFDMKFSVTGVYGISIQNNAESRSYIGTVTQNVANVRESKVVTLTLDTSGTWLYDSGIGLRLTFALAVGSGFQGSAGAWSSTWVYSTASQVNFMSSTSNIGYIGPIALYQGTYPVFSPRPIMSYAEHLRRCQRYLPCFKALNTNDPVGRAQVFTTTTARSYMTFPVEVRVPPTGVIISNATDFYLLQANGTIQALTVMTFFNASLREGTLNNSVASGLVAGNVSNLCANNSSARLVFTGARLS